MIKVVSSILCSCVVSVCLLAGNCGSISNVLPKAQTGTPGFTPVSDSFPVIIKGAATDQTIYFENYDTVRVSGTLISINTIKIDSIENLPSGLCWKTNKSNNTFLGKETGVIQITGSTPDPAGQYKLRIIVTANTNLITLQKVDLETLLGVRYYVRVGCSGSAPVKVDTASPYPLFKPYTGQVCNPLPIIALSSTASSVSEAAGVSKIIATINATSSSTVTANFSLTGTATINSDYTLSKNSFSIAPGNVSDTIVVTAVDDALIEGDETVIGTLTNATNSSIGGLSSQTVVIRDNDFAKVSLSADLDTVVEASTTVKLIATLNTPAVANASVVLTYSGSASISTDFTLSKTAFQFKPGQLKDTILVTVINDLIPEPIQSVSFTLSNPFGIVLDATISKTLTIIDDDALGIINSNIINAIDVYPSPAQESFKMDVPQNLDNLSCVILNEEGKTVKVFKLVKGVNQISTESMSTGVYKLLISGEDKQPIGAKTIQVDK